MRLASLAIVPATLIAAFVAPVSAQAAPAVWDRVASCESGGNWAINTGNSFYGGVQFTTSTWAAYGGHAYAAQANLASKAAQIVIAQRVLASQGPGAWPICSVYAGLTKANGGTVQAPAARSHLVVDGVIGPKTRAALSSHGIRLTTSMLVRGWQTRLGVRVDGLLGPKTIMALQRYLNAL